MIELIIGAILYWIVIKIDEHKRVMNRVKKAKKELFTDDRPKYETI
jgi:hypothetical protein